MRTVITNKGSYEVNCAWAPNFDGSCVIQYQDGRRLPEIASEWDGLETVCFIDEEAEKEYTWDGYNRLIFISRTINGIEIRLERG